MTDMTFPLTILFATATGNALVLAEFAEGTARRSGIAVRLADAATYDFKQLAGEETMLLITSTHEGEPPFDATDFFDFLDESAMRLSALRYAVLALGDTGYDAFCAAGRRVDERLEAMGATRLRDRRDIDAHEHKIGRAWIADFIASLEAVTGRSSAA